jgi:hypothetical protein
LMQLRSMEVVYEARDAQMSRMVWSRCRTKGKKLRPNDITTCKRCGRTILLGDRASHRCAGRSEGKSSPNTSRCRGHSPKPPKVKRPAPLPKGRGDVGTQQHLEPSTLVEAVYSKLWRQRRPGGDFTIPYKKGVRSLLALTEPVLGAAGLYGETRELARSCIREWCLQYYSLWGRDLANRLAYTFYRFRDKGIDSKALEKVLLTVDKELGPSS